MRETLTQNEASRFYLWSQTSGQDHIVMIYPRHNGQRGIGSFLLEINTIIEEIYMHEVTDFQTYLQTTLQEACNRSCIQSHVSRNFDSKAQRGALETFLSAHMSLLHNLYQVPAKPEMFTPLPAFKACDGTRTIPR